MWIDLITKCFIIFYRDLNYKGEHKMNNKVFLEKILAILVIASMLITNFSLVGSNLISYAIDMISTNNSNVEFYAYLENSNGESGTNIETTVNDDSAKLKIEVSVKNEGYFSGRIFLENSNFSLSDEFDNEYINKIENNTIYLNQINAGTTASFEIGIKYFDSESVEESSLERDTKINLEGTYTNSQKDEDIKGNTTVRMKWKSPEDATINIGSQLLTNYDYNINEENKRVVQFLVGSKVEGNSYPVKNTNIQITVPSGVQNIKVHKRTTLATNGDKEFNEGNYEYNIENGVITINVSNESDETGNIKWNKNAQDIFVVTLEYPENAELLDEEIKINDSITLYDEKVLTEETTTTISEEIDGIVSYSISNVNELYKGKIYTEEERDYETITIVNIDHTNIIQNIEITEKEAVYKKGEEEQQANIEYKQTRINKEDFLRIFGEEGYITIQDKDGTILGNITNESSTDENGNVIINYQDGIKEIKILTSAPKTETALQIEHTKTIKSDGYTREEKTELTGIKEEIEGKYIKNDETEKTTSVTKEIALKETETQIGLEVENNTISANTDEYQQIKMQIVLKANKENQNTYKNPSIKIEYPEEIREIAANVNLLYANGMEIEKTEINEENGKYVLNIELNGEQTEYAKEAEEGATIVVNTMVKVKEKIPSSNKEIIVRYTNENDINSEEKQEHTNLRITNENEMILTNSVENVETSTAEERFRLDFGEEQQIDVSTEIINNEGTSISDVKIIGKIPTMTDENGTEIKLTSPINIENSDLNAKIYYTEVENPSTDLSDKTNNWEETPREQSKNYLITIDNVEQGQDVTTSYGLSTYVETYGLNLESSYITEYVEQNNEKTQESSKIMLTSQASANYEQEISAKVGTETLSDNSEVKAGEIIDYTIRITNNTDTDLNGVTVSANIPSEATYIEYNDGYNNSDDEIGGAEFRDLYTAYEDTTEKIFSDVNIPANTTIELNYSVVIKEQITDGTTMKTTINSTGTEMNLSGEINHTIKTSNIVATLFRGTGTNEDELKVGKQYIYTLKLKNISSETIERIRINLNINEIVQLEKIEYILNDTGYMFDESEFEVENLTAGAEVAIGINVKINQPIENVDSLIMSAILSYNDQIFRTNEYIEDIENVNASVSISSDTETEYVKPGDTINYTIEVRNDSETELENLYVENQFVSEYLILDSVQLNGSDCEYTEEEYISDIAYTLITINTPLGANETATITISATVAEILEYTEEIEITNLVRLYNEYSIAEDEITHYIRIETEDPEDPTDPDNPEDPEDPTDPDNPEDPEDPTDPDNPENPEEPTDPENPENPEDPTDPENPEDPDNPDNPEDPTNPDDPGEEEVTTYSLSGAIWLDEDEDGIKDGTETLLSDIEVSLLDLTNNRIAQDSQGNEIKVVTDSEGRYTLSNIPEGSYIVIFGYDTDRYTVTTYQVSGADSTQNSDGILKTIEVNGESKTVAATDTIEISNNIENIDLGLVEAKVFDLELNKYVTRMVVTNEQGTETYNFEDETLAKVEIAAKYLSGSTVVIEYKIEVTNTGEIAGYARNIVDYFPTGLTFNSSLNPDWYQSENYIYNTSISDERIEPGETKELTLIATKTMTESNTGLVNNKAEIAESYNAQGIQDRDSTAANQANGEDDLGSADAIINVKTGEAIMYISLIIAITTLIGCTAYIVSKKFLGKKI